ncbi:MAG TPA: alpha/beta hydrolase [Gemmataceae bacterium]|jgi:acetyl esterase/lipase|nr:alpha/beta hydrolase [Gemmataceae bacterium]
MQIPLGGLLLACLLTGGEQSGTAQLDPSKDVTVFHNLRYREGPSKQWVLDLAIPKVAEGKPKPLIVVIHGGGWLEGDKSSFASRQYGVPGNIVDFAALGFVAATINYRLSAEAPYPAALEDCRSAIRWLHVHAGEYHIDPKLMGAYGNSAGGHLALLLGMPAKKETREVDGPHKEQSSRVQAVVSDSGPLDLLGQYQQNRLRQVVGQFMGGPPEGARVEAYRQASPLHQIAADLPPLMLIYGGADEQVPVESADQFVAALGRAGLKDLTYHRLAFVDHCPHSLVRIPNMQTAVNEFFVRTLMHPETAQQIQRRPPTR